MATTIDRTILRAQGVFGDHLQESERVFLTSIQQLFQSALDKQQGFGIVIETVADALKRFLKQTSSARLRLAFDAQNFMATFDKGTVQILEANTPLTEPEVRFANDVIDAIEFVMLNGIGFGLIAGALSHDVLEILKAGSRDKAIFNPKVSGWAEYHRKQIGDTESEDN